MSGYKAIKVNGIKYDEHRYFMEQFLDRKLNKDEVVHHIDGDKTNNNIENLAVMSLSDHSREHQTGRVFSDETRQKLSDAAKGRRSVQRKFNDNQVEQIRNLHNNGYSNRKIAKIFNVNHQTINDIINKKYYKN